MMNNAETISERIHAAKSLLSEVCFSQSVTDIPDELYSIFEQLGRVERRLTEQTKTAERAKQIAH